MYCRELDQVQLLLEDVAVTEVIMDNRDMKLVSKCAYLCMYIYVYVLRRCPLSHDTVLPCYSSLLACKSFSEAWCTRYVCIHNRYCMCMYAQTRQ